MKTLKLRLALVVLVVSQAVNLAFAGGGCASGRHRKTRAVREAPAVSALQQFLQSIAASPSATKTVEAAERTTPPRQSKAAVQARAATTENIVPTPVAEPAPVVAPATIGGFPADLPPSESSASTPPAETAKPGSLANLIRDFVGSNRR